MLTHIANDFIEDWNDRIPFTGWPTDEVYDKLKKKIDEKDGACIIVLDEIDKLVFKAGDNVLYNLSRINDDLKRAKVSVIGISNDLKFTEFLDPRVKSSLGEEEVIFPPYDAVQLAGHPAPARHRRVQGGRAWRPASSRSAPRSPPRSTATPAARWTSSASPPNWRSARARSRSARSTSARRRTRSSSTASPRSSARSPRRASSC